MNMSMDFITPPYLTQNVSVRRVMLQVLAALLPGVAVYVWLLGPAVLVQLGIATVTALVAEAGMLALRRRPLAPSRRQVRRWTRDPLLLRWPGGLLRGARVRILPPGDRDRRGRLTPGWRELRGVRARRRVSGRL